MEKYPFRLKYFCLENHLLNERHFVIECLSTRALLAWCTFFFCLPFSSVLLPPLKSHLVSISITGQQFSPANGWLNCKLVEVCLWALNYKTELPQTSNVSRVPCLYEFPPLLCDLGVYLFLPTVVVAFCHFFLSQLVWHISIICPVIRSRLIIRVVMPECSP